MFTEISEESHAWLGLDDGASAYRLTQRMLARRRVLGAEAAGAFGWPPS